MAFNLNGSIEILKRTPKVITTFLEDLSPNWIKNNEGVQTWSPYDIVGHLIHGEKTDWVPRMNIILSNLINKRFVPFDRFAQEKEDQTRTIEDLLEEFKKLRKKNIKALKTQKLSKEDLKKTGIHPDLGEVSLKELIATWTAHDLGHIAQISRVMAKQCKEEVGPWKAYLRIVN